MTVGTYIYEQAEVLDFAGPFEVFSTASRLSADAQLNVSLIGESGDAVRARGNFRVLPHWDFGNHPALDLLIIAGGVYTGEIENGHALQWISARAAEAATVASVCTPA
jgi:transcriptional regulator GlxA family with amidase domain